MEGIQDDVIVLAVGYGANLELARQLGPALTGKVVVDIANPVDFATGTLATAPVRRRPKRARLLLPTPVW